MSDTFKRSVLGITSPSGMKVLGILALSFIVVLIVAGVWINVLNIQEAFGSGPPYFNRTTNMDKWQNPIPKLVLIDSLILIIGVGLGKIVARCFRANYTQES